MAVIGTLGDIVFSVSRNQVKTIDNVKWNSSARYASHDRHMKDPLLEFTGVDGDTITFSMLFSAYLGVSPMNEIVKLFAAERDGRAMRLVIGPKGYGKNKWVITKTDRSLERFDKAGNLLAAKVNVTLKAYAAR